MTELCGKPMLKAMNGVDRGTCTKPFGHMEKNHYHSHCNGTCYDCGASLTVVNASASAVARGSGRCRSCHRKRSRQLHGRLPRNLQVPGKEHTFPCGCTGVLPNRRGDSNPFAKWMNKAWQCRVSGILTASRRGAELYGHTPIDSNTSHVVIRKLMDEPNCERCRETLKWDLGMGKTPHLHHDHESGEILGFTHPVCNPRAMEDEIEHLRKQIKKLQQIQNSKTAKAA
jgi:hypothetical protein